MTMRSWFPRLLGGLVLLAAIGMGNFGNVGPAIADEDSLYASPFELEAPEAISGYEEEGVPGTAIAYSLNEAAGAAAGEDFEQDPWEPFNETMFSFNRHLDRFLLKPVATVWDVLLPDPVQRSIGKVMDNLSVVRRLVNNIFQLKFEGAGREVARFTINSTIGVAGLFDVAKDGFGIRQSDEDTGQTLGVYGADPGPYLVLPFLPVMTVRDGIGLAADGAMNPLNYFIPFGATAGITGTDVVNDRSLNLDKFEQVEDSVVDLYAAVRNAYLQRRAAAIKE